MIRIFIGLVAALAVASAVSAADEGAATLRLIGEAPTVGEGAPPRFVIDAQVGPSEQAGEMTVEGWFGSFPPLNDDGEITGKCVHRHCELKLDLESHALLLSGDLVGATGPVQGRFEVTGDVNDALKTKGAVTLTPFVDSIPGFGVLAKPGSVDASTLDDLLLWQGVEPAFGDDDPHGIEDFQHEHIASWQQSVERPINGLLLVDDLALLADQRVAARKKAGWVTLGDLSLGWRAGYPAALLPQVSRNGAEQRFESADGKASLVIAIDPPMSDDDFDALSDKLHGAASAGADADTLNFTRTGPDIQVSYVKDGKALTTIYYHRKDGTARLVYTYPSGPGPLADIEPMISRSLRVTDALKPGS